MAIDNYVYLEKYFAKATLKPDKIDKFLKYLKKNEMCTVEILDETRGEKVILDLHIIFDGPSHKGIVEFTVDKLEYVEFIELKYLKDVDPFWPRFKIYSKRKLGNSISIYLGTLGSTYLPLVFGGIITNDNGLFMLPFTILPSVGYYLAESRRLFSIQKKEKINLISAI